jgi:DNA invertase Pin-like site-specific DNA recombinase
MLSTATGVGVRVVHIDPDEPSDLPMMFGYLRLPEQATDVVIAGWCQSMRAYCYANGYELIGVFLDGDSGSDSSFAALLDKLADCGARDIVVPDVERLHPHPALRRVRLNLLGDVLRANLHYSEPA